MLSDLIQCLTLLKAVYDNYFKICGDSHNCQYHHLLQERLLFRLQVFSCTVVQLIGRNNKKEDRENLQSDPKQIWRSQRSSVATGTCSNIRQKTSDKSLLGILCEYMCLLLELSLSQYDISSDFQR